MDIGPSPPEDRIQIALRVLEILVPSVSAQPGQLRFTARARYRSSRKGKKKGYNKKKQAARRGREARRAERARHTR